MILLKCKQTLRLVAAYKTSYAPGNQRARNFTLKRATHQFLFNRLISLLFVATAFFMLPVLSASPSFSLKGYRIYSSAPHQRSLKIVDMAEGFLSPKGDLNLEFWRAMIRFLKNQRTDKTLSKTARRKYDQAIKNIRYGRTEASKKNFAQYKKLLASLKKEVDAIQPGLSTFIYEMDKIQPELVYEHFLSNKADKIEDYLLLYQNFLVLDNSIRTIELNASRGQALTEGLPQKLKAALRETTERHQLLNLVKSFAGSENTKKKLVILRRYALAKQIDDFCHKNHFDPDYFSETKLMFHRRYLKGKSEFCRKSFEVLANFSNKEAYATKFAILERTVSLLVSLNTEHPDDFFLKHLESISKRDKKEVAKEFLFFLIEELDFKSPWLVNYYFLEQFQSPSSYSKTLEKAANLKTINAVYLPDAQPAKSFWDFVESNPSQAKQLFSNLHHIYFGEIKTLNDDSEPSPYILGMHTEIGLYAHSVFKRNIIFSPQDSEELNYRLYRVAAKEKFDAFTASHQSSNQIDNDFFFQKDAENDQQFFEMTFRSIYDGHEQKDWKKTFWSENLTLSDIIQDCLESIRPKFMQRNEHNAKVYERTVSASYSLRVVIKDTNRISTCFPML